MKKIQVILYFLSLYGFSFSQSIVSTVVENKNVILEEFTGINCSACPYGHTAAQNIMDANPNDVYIINIHTGYYANPTGTQPDFRTPFGSSIASQSDLTGYPAGTVNRHLFSMSQGGGTAMSRNDWGNASNQILGQSSYVNVAVESEINLTERILTVHVEAYYTGDSPQNENFLNVVLLQDNTMGYQSNGGSNYNHMHRLVHMLTGQWGEEITSCSTGTFIDRTYTYNIPTQYASIPVELNDLKVVAFISETTQEIISGSGSTPSTNGNITQNDVAIETLLIPEEVCETSIVPRVIITNTGQQTLNSLQFNYSVNGGISQSYSWTGSVEYGYSQEILLDEITYELLEENTILIEASMPNNENDDNPNNNSIEGEFNEAFHTTTSINMELEPGAWGFEISWELINQQGDVVDVGNGSDGYTERTFNLDLNNCYIFNLYDSYGNGFKPGGYLRLTGTDDIDIRYVEGDFGAEEIIPFKPTETSSITNLNSNIKIFPNPVNSHIYIKNIYNASVNIVDVAGKFVYSNTFDNNSEVKIDVSNLNYGIYFVNIHTDKEFITKKISVIK